MIRKILIANRGEIAVRIIRTCRDMGIATVAVYSDADQNALHVEMADEAIHLGASPAQESYLKEEAILDAARRSKADALHPGYGFLAENADFARACLEAKIIFLGPSPEAIATMGNKRTAKSTLTGIPIIPGYMGDDQTNGQFITQAGKMGYPLLIKAAAGGGGKGMHEVESPEELIPKLEIAQRESQQAFGESTLILERLLLQPRHIEIQIFGDQHGNTIALGERECTIQRRYQKVIEETPSTAVTPELREKMCDVAVQVARQLNYHGPGTVEFILDGEGKFYFLEMNTRLQVEHPVTELVTGVDLVRWHILIAEGRSLPQLSVTSQGHAIECRIYAEDPDNNFLPATGKILRWQPPQDIRIDTGVRSGDEVTVYYDPMLAKLIAWANTRDEAIRLLDHALSELQLLGVTNNITFLRQVLTHPQHLAGKITTHFITEYPELQQVSRSVPPIVLIAAALAQEPGNGYWRNNPNQPIRQRFEYQGNCYEIHINPQNSQYIVAIAGNEYQVQLCMYSHGDMILSIDGYRRHVSVVNDGEEWWVHTREGTYKLEGKSPFPKPETLETEGSLRAPMPGQIVAVMVKIGQQVQKGDTLVAVEAMKMEHHIKAPYSGTVTAVYCQEKQQVQLDAVLLELQKDL